MKKYIFLVENGANINKLESKLQEYPGSIVFTLDYEIHKLLEKHQIPHKLGENILTKEDFKKIDSYSINLTENCFDSFRKELTFKKIFLPELISHELFQYLLIEFLKPYVILKIIENNEIDIIFDFTNYSDFIKRNIYNTQIKHMDFTINNTSSLYHDKIKFTMHLANIPIHLELSRNTFNKIKKLSQKFINVIYNLQPKINNKKNILLVNFDPLEYENLLIELNNQNTNFFLLNTRKPAITNKKSLNIIRKSNSKILDINEFSKLIKQELLSTKNVQHEISKIFNNDVFFEKSFSINGMSFWHSIKKSFKNICISRFNESIERILLLNKLFESYDVSTIFVWVDVGQEEKECILVGRNFSIDSIMLQHGRFQTSKIWDKFSKYLGQFPSALLSDKQIVWGEITKQYALSHNHNQNDIIVGGSPRHDKFFNFTSKKSNSGIILLATTGTMFLSADSCVTSSQIRYDEYIREIYRIVKSLPGKKLVIKPHPSQILRKFVKDLIEQIDPTIPIIENMANEELFNTCELLITFNNSTTALEAISLGTPVISLQTENWAKEDDIVQNDGIVSVHDISECENAIKKILSNSEYRKNVLEKSNNFLNKYMSNPGNASKKVARILKHLSTKE